MNDKNQEKTSENIIIYDWLSFTSKVHTVERLKELLGLTDATWQ